MTSRRVGKKAGNSSPAVTRTYALRDRTINAVQQSDHSSPSVTTITNPEPNPQTHKPVEGLARKKHTKKAAKPVEPDIDDNSEDDSDYSSSSRKGLSEYKNRDIISTTDPSVISSRRRQPYPPPDDDIKSNLLRPPIYGASARDQPSQAKQDDEEKYFDDESWRDPTKSQSSSEGDSEEEKSFNQQKPRGQLKETVYKESRTLKISKPVLYQSFQKKPEDRGEESIVYQRFQQKPKDTELQTFQPRNAVGYSDDDEEPIRYGEERGTAFLHRFGGGDKRNHLSGKGGEQKAQIERKSPTKSKHFVGTCMKYLVLAVLALLVASAAVFYQGISPLAVLKLMGQGKVLDGPQVKKDLKDDFVKLTSIFTNQSPLMWKRSQRIMELHLQKWDGNTEPAIILLTGALDAEQTLLCLGTQLADIYSSSLNGNYTVISGSDLASRSNNEAKEYIDDHLSTGFQATTRAAVLHHLELLPAGSLLILYKYCDHETAVFKNVMLLLTVLMDDPTLDKDMSLLDLEEKVRAFLIQKLIDSNSRPSHDGMDDDKFSGVWSRISHVVLPVFPEKNVMEQCSKTQD